MRAAKGLTVEQLARALAHLSPSESKSLLELLDRENLKKRQALARRQVAKGKVVSEQTLFKSLR